MLRSLMHQTITWIDITNPSQADIQYLIDHFNFHEVILDELTKPGHRPKVGRYPDYLFLMLFYPVFHKARRIFSAREIEILVTKTHVITAHIGMIPPLHDFFNELENRPEIRSEYMDASAANLLFNIVHRTLENMLTRLDYIDDQLTHIEKQIFRGEHRKMVFEISTAKRDIIDFHRIFAPQTTIFESLVPEGENFFGHEFAPYFRDLQGKFGIIWNEIQDQRETIHALGETNESLRGVKVSEVIRVLTVFSVIFLPLSLIVNIWGMNVPLPLSNGPIDFWIILGIMAVASIVMVTYFKKKQWL